jgi:anti-anti-sigma factor
MWRGSRPGCGYAGPSARDGPARLRPRTAAGGLVDLKLGHYSTDGIEVVDVEGEIDIYSAPRLRELLIDLVSTTNYQLIVDLDKVGFLDSTGLGVLVGGLLAQQLLAAGERVLDVPPKLGARVRLLAAGDTNKNDPNDARSVAVAALRSPGVREARPDDHAAVLKVVQAVPGPGPDPHPGRVPAARRAM